MKKMNFLFSLFFLIATVLSACDTADDASSLNEEETMTVSTDEMARIVSVEATGMENKYSFSVGISSPDTGCNQYANWWEIVTEDGTLLYRRILAHSHVNEQPFIRSGGSVAVTANQTVIIRAHMNTSGYGNRAFIGSVNDGFEATLLGDDFAQSLESIAPLPDECAF